MKRRVTNRTAMNIYTTWMTLSAVEYDFVIVDKNMSLDDIAKADKNLIKLYYVLEDYSDKQLFKIIKGLEDGSAWEARYLKDILLHLFKAHLRQRKLNKLQID
jgi:hypothetical protein